MSNNETISVDQFVADAEEALEAPRENHKVRITAMLDGDIIDELKARAKEQNTKYQTLMNATLRKVLLGDSKETSEKESIKEIHSAIEKLTFELNKTNKAMRVNISKLNEVNNIDEDEIYEDEIEVKAL